MIFTVRQARTQLSRLIAAAEAGEEVIIARGDTPAVKLVPLEPVRPRRVFGAFSGACDVPNAFH